MQTATFPSLPLFLSSLLPPPSHVIAHRGGLTLVCVASTILFRSSALTLAWYSGVNSPEQTEGGAGEGRGREGQGRGEREGQGRGGEGQGERRGWKRKARERDGEGKKGGTFQLLIDTKIQRQLHRFPLNHPLSISDPSLPLQQLTVS